MSVAALGIVEPSSTRAEMPWILDILDGQPAEWQHMPMVDQAVDAIASRKYLVSAIGSLRRRWTDDVLVHGELRFGDVIVTCAEGPHRPWLQSWDSASPGLAEWDAAGVLVGLIQPALLEHPDDACEPWIAAGLQRLAPWIAGRPLDRCLVVASLVIRLAESAVQLAASMATGDLPVDPPAVQRIVDTSASMARLLPRWVSILEEGSA